MLNWWLTNCKEKFTSQLLIHTIACTDKGLSRSGSIRNHNLNHEFTRSFIPNIDQISSKQRLLGIDVSSCYVSELHELCLSVLLLPLMTYASHSFRTHPTRQFVSSRIKTRSKESADESMSLEPGGRQGNASPLSSGRSSPIPHRRKNTYDGI